MTKDDQHRSTIHGSRVALLLGRRDPARPLSSDSDSDMYWQQKEDDPSTYNSLAKEILSNRSGYLLGSNLGF